MMNYIKLNRTAVCAAVLGTCAFMAMSSVSAWAYEGTPKEGVHSSGALASAEKFNLKNSDANVAPTPGYGMLSAFGITMPRNCFVNYDAANNITMGNPVGTINLSNQISSAQMDSLLNIGAGLTVSYGPFSASVNAEYKKENSSNRYRQSLNYAQTYAANAVYNLPDEYGVAMLNKFGTGAYNAGQFSQVCGDSFVQSAQAGAVLLVTVNIDFNSSSDKNSFEVSASGGFGSIASVSAKFKQAVSNSKVDAQLRVTALQQGGDPRLLANVFGKENTDGDYAVVACSPAKVDQCTKIINDVISYAKNDFQKSIDKSQVYYYAPSFTKFANYGIGKSSMDLNDNAKAALKYLTTTLNQNRETKEYLDRYYDNVSQYYKKIVDGTHKASPTVPLELQGQVKTLQKQYDVLIDSYREAMNACFNANANTDCPVFAEKMKAKQKELADRGYAEQARVLESTLYITKGVRSLKGGTAAILVPVSVHNVIPTEAFPIKGLDFYNDASMKSIQGKYIGFINKPGISDESAQHMVTQCSVKFAGRPIDASLLLASANYSYSQAALPLVVCGHTGLNDPDIITLIQGLDPSGNNLLIPIATEMSDATKFFDGGATGRDWYSFLDVVGSNNIAPSFNPNIKAYDTLAYNPM